MQFGFDSMKRAVIDQNDGAGPLKHKENILNIRQIQVKFTLSCPVKISHDHFMLFYITPIVFPQ